MRINRNSTRETGVQKHQPVAIISGVLTYKCLKISGLNVQFEVHNLFKPISNVTLNIANASSSEWLNKRGLTRLTTHILTGIKSVWSKTIFKYQRDVIPVIAFRANRTHGPTQKNPIDENLNDLSRSHSFFSSTIFWASTRLLIYTN